MLKFERLERFLSSVWTFLGLLAHVGGHHLSNNTTQQTGYWVVLPAWLISTWVGVSHPALGTKSFLPGTWSRGWHDGRWILWSRSQADRCTAAWSSLQDNRQVMSTNNHTRRKRLTIDKMGINTCSSGDYISSQLLKETVNHHIKTVLQ